MPARAPAGDAAGELTLVGASLRAVTVCVRSAGRDGGAGAGVIWRPDGRIITNAHVVREPRPIVELPDGAVHHARLLARDPRRDLALLAIDAAALPTPVLRRADSLRVGELVLAAGHPLGEAGAVALGIVHAPAGGHRGEWIAADVRLRPGNSGGPLADALGRVVGINTMVIGGLGIAIGSDAVARWLALVAAGERRAA